MYIAAMLLTRVFALEEGKGHLSFSRFNFQRMKERGNTHYCFYCGGEVGFRPERAGRFIKRSDLSKPTNQLDGRGQNPMTGHDATHIDGVVGSALRYLNVWHWLEKEVGDNRAFPFVINIPQSD